MAAFLGTEGFQHIHKECKIVPFDEELRPTKNCPLVPILADFAVLLDLLIDIAVPIKAAKVGHQLLSGRCNVFGSWLPCTLIQKLLGSTRTSLSHLAPHPDLRPSALFIHLLFHLLRGCPCSVFNSIQFKVAAGARVLF
jgi:hypothetical protein